MSINWLEVLPVVFLIAGATSFVFAYVRGDVIKKTMDHLRLLSEVLEARIVIIEDERQELLGKIEHLEHENRILRSLVKSAVGDKYQEVLDSLDDLLEG
jgi:hypothetical protein